ncbi:MAG TPA: helix-turn-helix domain-containing protein [Ignavibacteriales bacterium]|nr:helix-turn-helix domain-containing protein [Ignavibacteriales bacterium]
MKREGVRQLYLSRRLKMDQGYLSRILSGKVVRPDVLIRISKILDSFEAKRKRKIRAA